MKLAPRNSQIIGRVCVLKSQSKIILVDPTRVTKFVYVDAVGEDVKKAGVKVGDVVLPTSMGQIFLREGVRPWLQEKDVGFFVRDVTLQDLDVQNETAVEYVAFDSPQAAKSWGHLTVEEQTDAVAEAAQ